MLGRYQLVVAGAGVTMPRIILASCWHHILATIYQGRVTCRHRARIGLASVSLNDGMQASAQYWAGTGSMLAVKLSNSQMCKQYLGQHLASILASVSLASQCLLGARPIC